MHNEQEIDPEEFQYGEDDGEDKPNILVYQETDTITPKKAELIGHDASPVNQIIKDQIF